MSTITGCFSHAPVFYESIGDRFVLVAVDVMEGMSLTRAVDGSLIQVIPPTVLAVGKDGEFVIVRQKERRGEPGRSEVFFVVSIPPVSEKWLSKDRIHGPFTEPEFVQARRRLGVSDTLQFEREFPKLME